MRVTGLGVRLAVVADGDAIGNAHASAWEAAYTHIFDASFLAAAAQGRRVGWSQSIAHILTPPNVLLVGEVDGTVYAFAHAVPAGDDSQLWEILGFYAHPDAWGTGLAALLMQRTCEALTDAGCDEVVLWTHRDAQQAHRFYEKAGFAPTGNARTAQLTDWGSAAAVDCPEVEYGKRIANASAP